MGRGSKKIMPGVRRNPNEGIYFSRGKGTRLFPLTITMSKQLLPVHDEPTVYNLLFMLILAAMREILVISIPDVLPAFRELQKDG